MKGPTCRIWRWGCRSQPARPSISKLPWRLDESSFHISSFWFSLVSFQHECPSTPLVVCFPSPIFSHTTIPPAFLLSYVNSSGDRRITCFLHWLPWDWQVFLLLDRNLESWKSDPFFILFNIIYRNKVILWYKDDTFYVRFFFNEQMHFIEQNSEF